MDKELHRRFLLLNLGIIRQFLFLKVLKSMLVESGIYIGVAIRMILLLENLRLERIVAE